MGLEADGHRDVPGPAHDGALRVAGYSADDIEPADLAVLGQYRLYGQDFGAVVDLVGDPGGGPLEVLVELDPQREKRLRVEEVHESAALPQEAQEAEVAGRIAHRDKVLEEGHLHRGIVDEHATVPAEGRLALQEPGSKALVGGGSGVVFLNRDGQREI